MRYLPPVDQITMYLYKDEPIVIPDGTVLPIYVVGEAEPVGYATATNTTDDNGDPIIQLTGCACGRADEHGPHE